MTGWIIKKCLWSIWLYSLLKWCISVSVLAIQKLWFTTKIWELILSPLLGESFSHPWRCKSASVSAIIQWHFLFVNNLLGIEKNAKAGLDKAHTLSKKSDKVRTMLGQDYCYMGRVTQPPISLGFLVLFLSHRWFDTHVETLFLTHRKLSHGYVFAPK